MNNILSISNFVISDEGTIRIIYLFLSW